MEIIHSYYSLGVILTITIYVINLSKTNTDLYLYFFPDNAKTLELLIF